jgi:hypothetical protein
LSNGEKPGSKNQAAKPGSGSIPGNPTPQPSDRHFQKGNRKGPASFPGCPLGSDRYSLESKCRISRVQREKDDDTGQFMGALLGSRAPLGWTDGSGGLLLKVKDEEGNVVLLRAGGVVAGKTGDAV